MKHYSSYLAVALTSTYLLLSCGNNTKENEAASNTIAKNALLNADNEFSNACATRGMKTAYLDFIDSNGVLLRPNVYPVVGADAIDYIIAQDDSKYTMSWKATDAIVAKSGELGYTYGVYSVNIKNTDTTFKGTYVTIWQLQPDGKWKFVLDTNNEGIGEETLPY
jgi:ketosteroid isomerase-like protein